VAKRWRLRKGQVRASTGWRRRSLPLARGANFVGTPEQVALDRHLPRSGSSAVGVSQLEAERSLWNTTAVPAQPTGEALT